MTPLLILRAVLSLDYMVQQVFQYAGMDQQTMNDIRKQAEQFSQQRLERYLEKLARRQSEEMVDG